MVLEGRLGWLPWRQLVSPEVLGHFRERETLLYLSLFTC